MAPGSDGFPGPYAQLEVGLELYDLENDISETNNVVKQHPEIVARLQRLAQQARDELGDKLTNCKGSGVRPHGRLGAREIRQVTHLAVGAKLSFAHPFSSKYTGGADNALVDGLTGTADFTDGTWQGFEGDDMDITLDLGTTRRIKKITCSFLENQGSWIFFPEKIEISVSENGSHFTSVKQYAPSPVRFSSRPERKEFSAALNSKKIRFIRVFAKNIGICPEWHRGTGGKAWIFADEIVVK